MHKLANAIGRVARHDHAVSNKDNANVDSTNEVDDLVRALSSIIVAARDLPDEDHARVRRFISASADLMLSRDRLGQVDRQLFEAALRDAAGRRHN